MQFPLEDSITGQATQCLGDRGLGGSLSVLSEPLSPRGPQPVHGRLRGVGVPHFVLPQCAMFGAAFARTGNPDHMGLPYWPAYEASTRATMIFDDECKVVNERGKDG